MDATPRMRSAFPATPPRTVRGDRRPQKFGRSSPAVQREPLPQIPTLKSSPSPASEPLIPERIIDAPSQRLYAVAFWVALLTWRLYDFTGLQESEEQSLWLFMKWVAIDGVFLFGLPSMRIPWLEWSSANMTLIFLAHAVVDCMLMFRIPIPMGAALAAIWRGVYGAYETAVNEHNVNPNSIMFNDSLILGRQVIHVLPEGSAVLNPERESFCLDSSKPEIRLPITINATNPISMEIVRFDLDTQADEKLQISKSQIKTMHKEASRLLSYNEDPHQPKTLYYPVKKPGVYILTKVVDESNLEVSRKRLAHTVVVSCPKAAFVPTDSNRCRGDLSNVELEVIGTPPMKVKYHRVVNDRKAEDSTRENIQPDDLASPLQSSIVLPDKIETEWAKTRSLRVSLSEGMTDAGRWVYAVDEVTDGLGNNVRYSSRDQQQQERQPSKSIHLHQTIVVHERPNVQMHDCTPERPLKIASGNSARLPLRYGSTGKGEINNTPYHLKYEFSPQADLDATGERITGSRQKSVTLDNNNHLPAITEPGLYTLTEVSTDFCAGDVLEPASCLLQNPPKPQLSITHEQISDKCAGRPVGLRVNLDMIGTPPFEVHYRAKAVNRRDHWQDKEPVSGLRGQIVFTPQTADRYEYEIYSISDAVYKNQPLPKSFKLEQDVKPSASARFMSQQKQITCIDQTASLDVYLVGEAPFRLEYEVVHAGKRKKYTMENITAPTVRIETEPLRDGGDYTIALVSITDLTNCREYLKDETKVSVLHQKPKVGFRQIEGRRTIDTLEGKTISLPLRLAGEGPWTVTYLDANKVERRLHPETPNERLDVHEEGLYQLTDVHDKLCPGVVDDMAKEFEVKWIPRPAMRVRPEDIVVKDAKNSIWTKHDVCEGNEDSVELLFRGSPPYTVGYIQSVKLDHGVGAPKSREVRAALNSASLRMDTSQAGQYKYELTSLKDGYYDPSSKHFTRMTIEQRVHARPSIAFTNPGKTYSFCSVESEGEEVIPIILQGQPPFDIEVEIKHHGTIKPEIIQYTAIPARLHSIRIPHTRLHLGKSAVSLRRVSDARGCARTLDSTIPRVQISVHDAPTITPMEIHTDYCVGDRINFGLSGVAPFDVSYTFQGAQRKAKISSGNAFRRLAEKPGVFTITGLQDSSSACIASTNITKVIHGMPSVRVSKGKDSYVDIHEGGQAEITFDFGGVPPFEFTYTRSSNTEKGGKKPGVVLDMRSEISEEKSMKIWASEEGTYEVVAIKDAHCAYAKPGIEVKGDKKKRLGY